MKPLLILFITAAVFAWLLYQAVRAFKNAVPYPDGFDDDLNDIK